MRISDWSSDVCSSDLHRYGHVACRCEASVQLGAPCPVRAGADRDRPRTERPHAGSRTHRDGHAGWYRRTARPEAYPVSMAMRVRHFAPALLALVAGCKTVGPDYVPPAPPAGIASNPSRSEEHTSEIQ